MSGGTLARAQSLVRAVAVPCTGESADQARRRAAEVLGLTLRQLERLFYGESGVSPMTAFALLQNEQAVLRAELAQAEAERIAVERRSEELRRRLAALGDNGACGVEWARGCAPGVGSVSSFEGASGEAPARSPSSGSPAGRSSGSTTRRTASCGSAAARRSAGW